MSVVQDDSAQWPVLERAKVHVGSRLGLALGIDRRLHLYVDNKHEGVVAPHIPDPCYFMFDLYRYCRKVLHCFNVIARNCQFSCCYCCVFICYLSFFVVFII